LIGDAPFREPTTKAALTEAALLVGSPGTVQLHRTVLQLTANHGLQPTPPSRPPIRYNRFSREVACRAGSRLGPIVSLGLATGCRLGELMALRWRDIDGGIVNVERSLEQTKGNLRFKEPKSRHGRRKVTLPPSAVADLDRYRRQLGVATHPDALVFSNPDGSPIRPNAVSVQWNREIRRIKRVPPVVFHSLRHTHASALIRAGIDVVSVSRRLGHSSPVITLKVYAHLFGDEGDGRAAEAIETMLG